MSEVTSLIPDPPDPPRPLGAEGRRLWDALWNLNRQWIDRQIDVEHVALLCESMDERIGLRVRTLRSNDWRDRVALRALEAQIAQLMAVLGLNPTDRKALAKQEGTGDGTSRL